MKLGVVDLFCGAGGSSLGARKAETEILMGIDAWPRAIESYCHTFKGRGYLATLGPDTDASAFRFRKGEVQILMASPECTNHTCAKGSADRSEESKRTANYVLNFVEELQPRWVVIENVIQMKNWHGYDPLLSQLDKLGYGVTPEDIDAS